MNRVMRRLGLPALVLVWVLSTPVALSAAPAAVPLAPAPQAGGQPLREPRVYAGHHGVLRVTLVASRRRATIAGRRLLADVYNGMFTAPTLVASPGDRVRVRLVNRLGQPTNLHFHGLEISPSGHADNVFVSVAPGHTFIYSCTATSGAFRVLSPRPSPAAWSGWTAMRSCCAP